MDLHVTLGEQTYDNKCKCFHSTSGQISQCVYLSSAIKVCLLFSNPILQSPLCYSTDQGEGGRVSLGSSKTFILQHCLHECLERLT